MRSHTQECPASRTSPQTSTLAVVAAASAAGARTAAFAGLLLGPACIKDNPEFIEGTSSQSTGGLVTTTSSSSDSGTTQSTGVDPPTSSTGSSTTTTDPGGSTQSTADECSVEVGQEATPIDLGVVPSGSAGVMHAGQLDGEFPETWIGFESDIGRARRSVLASVVPAADFELCAFVECVPPFENVIAFATCEDDEIDSPGGRPGCCGESNVTMEYRCQDEGVSANLWLRVRSTARTPECRDYSVSFEVQVQ